MGELTFQNRSAADDADRPSLLRAAFEHLQAGRFAETADLAQQLIAAQPRDVEALLLLGLALGAQGETERAVLLLTKVGRERPNHAHPCHDLADLLRRLDRVPEACAQFRAARELEPTDVRLAYAHAEFLLETGQPEAALVEVEAALALRPGFPSARRLWAIVLAESGRMDEAIAYFRRAVVTEPASPEARANLAVALVNSGAFEAGLAAYEAALFLAPDDAVLHVQRAMALLKSGRLAEGFAAYEWRARQPGHADPLPRELLLPNLADVGDDLAGRTVLLTHDEGLGDTLQFLRYAPLLAAHNARVLAFVPRELAQLLRGVPAFAAVLSGETPLPHFDFHCPFISLPRAFGTTLATIPADIPYLFADPALAASWAERLPDDRRLRVGLVWSGSPRPANRTANLIDRRRSLALAALAPLTAVPAAFVSLQLGARAAELRCPPPGLALHDPMPDVADFADTAAIVANLDIVVSVDTSVAHLAGAMGKPVFLLDRHDNCWRWLSERTDSPWYPGLRIFRQARPGDWAAPVAAAAVALRELASNRC